jgi:hypothetical protein
VKSNSWIKHYDLMWRDPARKSIGMVFSARTRCRFRCKNVVAWRIHNDGRPKSRSRQGGEALTEVAFGKTSKTV